MLTITPHYVTAHTDTSLQRSGWSGFSHHCIKDTLQEAYPYSLFKADSSRSFSPKAP